MPSLIQTALRNSNAVNVAKTATFNWMIVGAYTVQSMDEQNIGRIVSGTSGYAYIPISIPKDGNFYTWSVTDLTPSGDGSQPYASALMLTQMGSYNSGKAGAAMQLSTVGIKIRWVSGTTPAWETHTMRIGYDPSPINQTNVSSTTSGA